MMEIDKLITVLHENNLSCVIQSSNGELTYCRRRGVIDLYELLMTSQAVLNGAILADKVVGRGAAALMVMGCVKQLHTDVLSRPALEMLRQGGVEVSYGKLVDNIINRAGDDICPVEKLTSHAATAAEALPLIGNFIAKMAAK